ncbi:putative ATP synthase subunit f, mitochondrial [Apis dorsata]|uniref:putative ATP synthase subunit f, mitochondrial n=1 Tax=Apis dorsata TaxID=7462 RepID=UPI0003DF72E4|nr:putative ATP synthase subunit f, mitochondrial [Apis dorsata]
MTIKENKFTELIKFKSWGCYPEGYNPAEHGPYDPSRYYGKPDTPFGDVKLGELSAWFSRREKGLRQFAALISRAHWRWQLKYIHPRKANMAPLYQAAVLGSIFGYCVNYLRLRGHRNYKYH